MKKQTIEVSIEVFVSDWSFLVRNKALLVQKGNNALLVLKVSKLHLVLKGNKQLKRNKDVLHTRFVLKHALFQNGASSV